MIAWILEQIKQGKCYHKWGYLGTTRHFASENSKLPYKATSEVLCVKCGKFKKIAVTDKERLKEVYK